MQAGLNNDPLAYFAVERKKKMDETQIEETSTENQVVEPVADEPTAIDLLLDEIVQLKVRVARLESVAHSGHELNDQAVTSLATLVIKKINQDNRTAIQTRLA